MVKITDFKFFSSDGQHDVHGRMWIPDGRVRGVVQIVHGVAEHVGRYHDFASFLAEHGFLAAGDDHLGHGYTARDESELGWFGEKDGWNFLVQDEKRLRGLLARICPGVPMILLGHSMGSFIARTYICLYPDDFDGCILSGTGYHAEPVCRAGMALARQEIVRHGSRARSKKLQSVAFSGYLSRVKEPIGENDWICRDEAVIRAYDSDPLCGWTATAGLMYDMMSGLDMICRSRYLAQMNKAMPVLFISGGDDPVGAYGKGVAAAARLFRRAAMEDVTVKLYPGARHEILNELNRREVWSDILRWTADKI